MVFQTPPSCRQRMSEPDEPVNLPVVVRPARSALRSWARHTLLATPLVALILVVLAVSYPD